ncbi:MAG: hypothetical protein P1V51_17290 [Deltaproteobacteria bacterium]|nr:hypothetical protein [Deltaproteobacteria bacterium]
MSNPMGSDMGGAVCAQHPERNAQRTCERCGAYMCSECTEGGFKDTCPDCVARTGGGTFPLSREDWSFDQIFSISWERWKPEWLMISVGMLIIFGVTMVFNVVSQVIQAGVASAGSVEASIGLSLIFSFAQSLIQGVIQLGFYLLCIDVLMGKPANLGLLFTQFAKVGKLLVQLLVMGLIIVVPLAVYAGIIAGIIFLAGLQDSEEVVLAIAGGAFLLVLFPLIWVSLGFYFMQMELAFDDEVGPIDAIKRSFALVDGHRLGTFGVAFVAGLVAMLGIFACGIGIIVSAGLSQLILCGLYLALRNGSDLPAVNRDLA